jgi:hypothetical protein
MTSRLTIPLIASQRIFSYPKEAEQATPVRYFPLADVLTRAWTTDAHITAYSMETLPYRLSKDAVQIGDGVVMVLFITDVDCEQSHAASGGHGDVPASDEWWVSELDKIDRLIQAFPGAFIYRTKGGYRILYLLPSPWMLASTEDVESWRADYLAWVAALRRRFKIYADTSCHDWQRLYRVPHATRRHGGRPEALEMIGNPYQIGHWTCEPNPDERELAKTLAKKPSNRASREHRKDSATSVNVGDGILFHAFKARGWLGEAIDASKWSVKCPWDDRHTKGIAYNTSTVLFAPGSGDTFGWLHCSHAHCQDRDIRDVLRVFSEDELTQAKRQAGAITSTAKPKRQIRMYQPHFGLRVREVSRAS